jgi:hypothetical protein
VLLSFRQAAIPELDAAVGTTALVHSRYRVHVIHNRNVVCEDDVFLPSIARIGRVTRPVLTLVLAGRARVRLATGWQRWLDAGDVVLLPVKAIVSMRQEGCPFRSVAIEWDDGILGGTAIGPDDVRLDPTAFSRALALADALESCRDTGSASTFLADLVALLRAEGAPFLPVEDADLVEPVSTPVMRLSRALDVVLSRLAEGPALSDLDSALGLSVRHMNRVITQFNQRYGFNSLGWRDTRNRRRMLVGATMMTAPGARTDLVARAMGYSSPTGFCHAFDLAGLPSPSSVAERVARLR